jgi:hypothetical protein
VKVEDVPGPDDGVPSALAVGLLPGRDVLEEQLVGVAGKVPGGSQLFEPVVVAVGLHLDRSERVPLGLGLDGADGFALSYQQVVDGPGLGLELADGDAGGDSKSTGPE